MAVEKFVVRLELPSGSSRADAQQFILDALRLACMAGRVGYDPMQYLNLSTVTIKEK